MRLEGVCFIKVFIVKCRKRDTIIKGIFGKVIINVVENSKKVLYKGIRIFLAFKMFKERLVKKKCLKSVSGHLLAFCNIISCTRNIIVKVGLQI
jgi:hypothetical protein